MRILLICTCLLFTQSAFADVASTTFVNNAIESKVDTSSTANQDLQGTYTVSGTLTVPTQPLPANEIVQ